MKNRPRSDGSWKLIEHTADIRAEVTGSTLEELFLNAARGLTGLLYSGSAVDAASEIDLILEGDDVEEILVDWLREILYRKEAEGLVFVRADVAELSAESFKVRAFFGPVVKDDYPEVEIKAVTYHGLSVERNDSGFTAKILFDI